MGAEIGIIAYGSTDPAIQEAINLLDKQGVKINYLRLRSLPGTNEVQEFIQKNHQNFVVELNRDGQLCLILRSEFPVEAPKIKSLAHLDGLPLTAKWLIEAILAQEAIKYD
jgi:2-oxoglutarate ferredoxin oxidoreductase subunit alpha